jgi:hypothetical protein
MNSLRLAIYVAVDQSGQCNDPLLDQEQPRSIQTGLVNVPWLALVLFVVSVDVCESLSPQSLRFPGHDDRVSRLW